MEKLNRKKFFSFLTKTALFTTVISALPINFIKSLNKASEEKINIKINPDAIKRNKVLR
ncbi:MAG: hypothetical protein N2321_08365 [Melioribacteraceae bacterium]|nr:hypothetical protein [Melioribacteraceae bacterium]